MKTKHTHSHTHTVQWLTAKRGTWLPHYQEKVMVGLNRANEYFQFSEIRKEGGLCSFSFQSGGVFIAKTKNKTWAVIQRLNQRFAGKCETHLHLSINQKVLILVSLC